MKGLGRDDLAFPVCCRNLPVLAEKAVAGTAGKEDGAGAARAAEAGFLAHVRPPGGDAQLSSLAADASVSF